MKSVGKIVWGIVAVVAGSGGEKYRFLATGESIGEKCECDG